MPAKCRSAINTVTSILVCLLMGSAAIWGQLQHSQIANTNRIVGPQRDGSIVVSDNQRLTPTGKIIELGSPVRAKAIALNPDGRAKNGAVLLMGADQPIIVFNTETGQVLQRF